MEFFFDDVARLPMAGDNVAIASRRLEEGTRIRRGDAQFELDFTILHGHRFAVEPIPAGDELLSWELPFGVATREIVPGNYVCNDGMLKALSGRSGLGFALPAQANFADRIQSYSLNEAEFQPGQQVDLVDATTEANTFDGYDRSRRGAGTRNYIVVLGTSSRTASFARNLASRLHAQTAGERGSAVDGIVAVAHTEGGTHGTPNNRELLLRTLSGFCVHPNVGAVLAVDYGTEAVSNHHLQEYMRLHEYPIDDLPHAFMSIDAGLELKEREAETQIRQWLALVAGCEREALPLSRMKLALQCGGSDAFSGISGNPLAGWVARELIRHGGSANLAETDELIGAEPYVLANVRDVETAQRFLGMIERFQERAGRHGVSAEGNPSGGNKMRGLYNIVLKSIGAARKRDPAVRLDGAIEYSERMEQPGYYFMDSPGNDLESIAGQVASGCNMIFFVTGNGSITNFPFVPTVKIVTTSERFALLAEDMDVNAGAYQDGCAMDQLGAELLDLTIRVSSGARSKGERAGHAQLSIWRNWEQQDSSRLNELVKAPELANEPIEIRTVSGPSPRFTAIKTRHGCATDQVGLVLPTSLCSGQIARMATERLNATTLAADLGLSRFVTLVHTEGCGVGMEGRDIGTDTLLGYLLHPLVGNGLLLEHGCEKTHNDFFRERLGSRGVDGGEQDRFGWASVQMDGGIHRAMERIEEWFGNRAQCFEGIEYAEVGMETLRLGVTSDGPMGESAASSMARLCQWVVAAGGTIVVPENASIAHHPAFCEPLFGGPVPAANLAHGHCPATSGFYSMNVPVDHWVETMSGLGATGVEIMLAHVGEHPLQGHPMIPLLQVASEATTVSSSYGSDIDAAIECGPGIDEEDCAGNLLRLVIEVASRQRVPRAVTQRNTDFQLTRGLLGVSL